ncbi:MAG: hypothetical protein K5892_01945 [Acholeplasmatales bacterium]|jgi:hypothetical protein|nr:hypothetical protein [Acholeplasmatales bacterium]
MDMTYEQFKKEVEFCLRRLNVIPARIKYLLNECEDYLKEAYEKDWNPMVTAMPLSKK